MVVNKRKPHLKRLRDTLYMEEKIRSKAVIAKFDEDIKAAAVCFDIQILVLYAQHVKVWHSILLARKSTRISQAISSPS